MTAPFSADCGLPARAQHAMHAELETPVEPIVSRDEILRLARAAA